MRICVFTSNQPRHTAFIEKLERDGHYVTAVVETMPMTAGVGYHRSYTSDTMREYFERVHAAERKVFGIVRPIEGVKVLPLAMNDAGLLSGIPAHNPYIVFGSSYIKGPLCDWLVERKAINIHLGVSPEYRGSSCNFWAMYDNRPDLVGATIHLLSKGLDSGDILFHVKPEPCADPFEFTMRAVDEAQKGVIEWLKRGADTSNAKPQDKSKQIRYTKASDFTDEIAAEYLARIDRR